MVARLFPRVFIDPCPELRGGAAGGGGGGGGGGELSHLSCRIARPMSLAIVRSRAVSPGKFKILKMAPPSAKQKFRLHAMITGRISSKAIKILRIWENLLITYPKMQYCRYNTIFIP